MSSTETLRNSTTTPKVVTLLACTIAVAVLLSGSAMAGHGVGIAKDCFKAQRCQNPGDPDPTTGLPLDCDNNDACDGVETCDETGTNIMRCNIEMSYNDEFGDTILITAATDDVDPDGTAGVGPITVPIGGGNLPISEVSGNTTCVVGPFAPCSIGPPDGFVVFRHEHGLDGMVGYVIDADDPNNIPDRATVTVQDACDQPAGQDSCNELPNDQQFGSNTKVEDGCLPGTPPNCNDGNECTNDSCDPALGCQNIDRSAECDDGNECTADSCDPATGCVNDDISANCDDNNECTADSCDPAVGCVNDDISADCDDNNECTADSCDPAVGCVNDDISADCDDNNECTADSCDPATGCVNDDISADCDDNNECTADSCDPATGCVNDDISANCDDNNECTADSCDPATGCVNDDISANCDDNNECTADSCDPATGCVNDDISADCDDNNECTADSCDPATGCVNDDISANCDDNNECTADSCDPATGCVNDDISANCNDNNECTADSCDPATGCVNDDISDDCDDGNECTADSCDPATGCVNDDISDDCDDNNECTADSCDPAIGCVNDDTSDQCVDDNPCTDDSCDPATGCVYECNPGEKDECKIVIGDFIWEDTNGNGAQDGSDADNGIDDVTINLLDCDGTPVEVDDTTTAADGSYEFTIIAEDCDLTQRKFQIEVDDDNNALDGLDSSPPNNADDAIDSDCEEGGVTDCVMYDYGDTDSTVDCGYTPPPGVSICRTPGFWGTHGYLTALLYESIEGGVEVCGNIVETASFADKFCGNPPNCCDGGEGEPAYTPDCCTTNPSHCDISDGDLDDALEHICVSVEGVHERQISRQLAAFYANCIITGAYPNCDSLVPIASACNEMCDFDPPASAQVDIEACQQTVCDADPYCCVGEWDEMCQIQALDSSDCGGTNGVDLGDPDPEVTASDCISQLDCFNNGGTWIVPDNKAVGTPASSIEFDVAGKDGSVDARSAFDEGGESDNDAPAAAVQGEGPYCSFNLDDNCHLRDLCPADEDGNGVLNDDEEGWCFESPGPAQSSKQCTKANKNDCTIDNEAGCD